MRFGQLHYSGLNNLWGAISRASNETDIVCECFRESRDRRLAKFSTAKLGSNLLYAPSRDTLDHPLHQSQHQSLRRTRPSRSLIPLEKCRLKLPLSVTRYLQFKSADPRGQLPLAESDSGSVPTRRPCLGRR